MQFHFSKIKTAFFFLAVLFLPNFVFAGDILNENFDSFNTGNLSGQGQWLTGPAGATVSDVQSHSADNAVYMAASNGSGNAYWEPTGSTNLEAQFSAYIYFTELDNTSDQFIFSIETKYYYSTLGMAAATYYFNLFGTGTGTELFIHELGGAGGTSIATDLSLDTWHLFESEMNYVDREVRARVNSGTWSSWIAMPSWLDGYLLVNLAKVDFRTQTTSDIKFYFDDVVAKTSEDSGTIEIIKPVQDSSVNGNGFDFEINYWNYGASGVLYDRAYWWLTDTNWNVLNVGVLNLEIDNIEEEKNIETVITASGSFSNAIINVELYHSETGTTSDFESQDFSIYTGGFESIHYNYSLEFMTIPKWYLMEQKPFFDFNNENVQLIYVSAQLGEISCDDIVEGYFDFNSYTNSSFTVIDSAETIDEFIKYDYCLDNKVILALEVEADQASSTYYQVDYYETTSQLSKLNFLRFEVVYDVDGSPGGVIHTDLRQEAYCEDLTLYIPNLFSDIPFEINFFNSLCKAFMPSPTFMSDNMNKMKNVFDDKFGFVFQIKTKIDSVSGIISGGSTSPPNLESGSWKGMSFNISDMFGGMSTTIVWIRQFLAILMWFAFILWFLKDVKELFATNEVGENSY